MGIRRTIERIIMLALSLVLCASVNAWGDVAINETNFPDAAFRQCLFDYYKFAKDGILTDEEIKYLLFDRKWIPRLYGDINAEIDRILNDYASRVIMIAKRYEHTLGEIEDKTAKSKEAVRQALERMGYKW